MLDEIGDAIIKNKEMETPGTGGTAGLEVGL